MTLSARHSALTRAEVITRLREHAVMPTQQRIEIGQLLFGRPQHVSAEQVLAMVNQGRSHVSKATVYNTLGLFAEKGLVREVVVDPNKLFYDSNLEPHHHFYHVETGTLEDVPADQITIDKLPEMPDGTTVEGVDVIIRVSRGTE